MGRGLTTFLTWCIRHMGSMHVEDGKIPHIHSFYDRADGLKMALATATGGGNWVRFKSSEVAKGLVAIVRTA